jgi:ribosomal protein S18 acetylase RimI-like enzyme
VALRVDRCVSLQLNDDLQRRGIGRTALLLAEMDVADEQGEEAAAAAAAAAAPAPPPPPPPLEQPLSFPRPLFFLSRLLQPSVRAGLDAALAEGSRRAAAAAAASAPPPPPPARAVTTTVIVGTATVDSFGDLVPPKQLDPARDGAFGWAPRHGGDRNHYAYVSNVAVAPSARRRGVARRLVRAAERLAAGGRGLEAVLEAEEDDEEEEDEDDARDDDRDDADDQAAAASAAPAWRCGAAALHCSPENEAALGLYAAMGYRRVALEPAWAPYLNGRGSGGRCYLMVRRLRRRRRREGGGGGGGREES